MPEFKTGFRLSLSFFLLSVAAHGQSVATAPCEFAGAGLNDAICGFGYAANARYEVRITAAGAPDHFQWSKNGGPLSAPIAITGGVQPLSDGATISFSATTGHRTGASWNISAAVNGTVAEYKSIQPGSGAIFRSQLDVNRDQGADVKDFGALCDGSTDDTSAIQKAFNAMPGNGRLTISGPLPCVISHMVYIPTSAEGMILEATRLSPGGGLVAKSGLPAFQMLREYATRVHLKDLYLNCNGTALNGLVLVNSLQSVIDNVVSTGCVGDAIQLDPFASPSGTTTSALTAGAKPGTIVTVASAELIGLTLGGTGCASVVLDYGKPNQEYFWYTRSGNTLTQFLPESSIFPHSAGASIQCNGNNDSAILNNVQGIYSAGWGLDMMSGSDNNAVTIRDPTMFSNKTGGEILSGSVGRHIGGHMEGNDGPAIQLGDITGGGPNGTNGRGTFAWTIDPVNDLENSMPSYNGVKAVCDGLSHVMFKNPDELTFSGPGGPYCPAFPAGVSTLGTGYDANATGSPRLTVKVRNGTTVVDPIHGLGFFGATGLVGNIYGPANATISGQLNFGPDAQVTGNQLNLQASSAAGEIAVNRSGKPNTPVVLYNGESGPKVVLNPSGNSSFVGVQATGLAGAPNRPACIDGSGNIYAGTNSGGVLTCP